MERDWDCVRAVLVGLEGLSSPRSLLRGNEVEGFDTDKASYHIYMMIQAGMIEGQCTKTLSGPMYCHASSMTWAGHELLDSIRQKTVWERVKGVARERGVDLTFDAVKIISGQVLAGLLK